MTTIAVLVGAILAATGPLEFPARINTTADALAAQAETRFNQSSDLLTFCSTLYENTQTGTYVATWAGMTDEDVEVFSFFLTVNTALDGELRLNGQSIGVPGAIALAEGIRENKGFTSMWLHNNNFGPEGCSAIGDALSDNTALTILRLGSTGMTDAGVIGVARGLKQNSVLLALDLLASDIGDAGAAELGDALRVNHVLSELVLKNNAVGGVGLAGLGRGIAVNKGLTKLDLENNQIQDSEIGGLAEGLKTNAKLEWLGLSQNQISDSGAAELAQALHTNKGLLTMRLGSNQINSAGVAAFGPALFHNSVLEILQFGFNTVGDDGVVALADGLKVNTKLTTLSVRFNSVSDAGAKALGDALRTNIALSSLDLTNNAIDDPGTAAIAEGLRANAALTELKLDRNNVDDAGADALGQELKYNAALSYLALTDNNVSATATSAMETAFAQRVQAMGSDSGFTSPTTTTITANQESLQTTDPLSVGDLVIKILEHEVVWSVTAVESSAGTGAYTLESTEDSTITLASVERWELYRYCPAGTWLQTLDSGCVNISCSEGDPNANDQEGLRFVDDPCAHCGPGAYLNETDCLECPAGSFGVIAGHTSLRHGCALQCPAGRYGSVVGASSEAEACPGACSVGKFGDAPGATSAEEACPGVCPASTWGSVVGGGSVEEACPNACPPGSCGTVEGATTQDEACHSVCPIVQPQAALWMDRTSTVTGRLGHRLFPNRTHEGALLQGGVTYNALTATVTRYGVDEPAELVPRSHLEGEDSFPAVYGHAGTRWGHTHWYLLHGGLSGVDATTPSDASVYLYDRQGPQPSMKTMHVTINGTLAAPPLAHHEMVYAGGKAFVVGGLTQDGTVSSSVYAIEAVDPASSSVTWTAVSTAGSGFAGRYGHCAVAHDSSDGGFAITVFGGYDTRDTVVSTVTTLASTSTSSSGITLNVTAKAAPGAPAVAHHACAPFALGVTEAPGVVVFGGVLPDGGLSHTVHVFDGFVWSVVEPTAHEHLGSGFSGHSAAFMAQAYAHTSSKGIVFRVHGGGEAPASTVGEPVLSTLVIEASQPAVCPPVHTPYVEQAAMCALNRSSLDAAATCDCLQGALSGIETDIALHPHCDELRFTHNVLRDMHGKSCAVNRADCADLYLGVSLALANCSHLPLPGGRCACTTKRIDSLPAWTMPNSSSCPLFHEYEMATGCSDSFYAQYCYPAERASRTECEASRGPWGFTCLDGGSLGIHKCPAGHVYDGRGCVPYCSGSSQS